VKVVSAVTRHWDDNVCGETFTSLTIQFAGGAVGTMNSNWHSLELPECRLRIDGTGGSALSCKRAVGADEATLTVSRVGIKDQTYRFSQEKAAQRNMGQSMKELLDAVSSGRMPHHSGEDNLKTMAIVDAAYLSASQGGRFVQAEEIL
jgi:predicted dehydrogenase